MAVSKKKRFEVFKRDKFRCQYCGNRPPETVLECDHIHPVSKGGSDDYSNLITSCLACNRGKSNHTLETLDADAVAAMQLETIAQLAAFNRMLSACQNEIDELALVIAQRAKRDWNLAEQMPADHVASIRSFLSRGLSFAELCESVDIASRKNDDAFWRQWKYFCGICWNKLKNGGSHDG